MLLLVASVTRSFHKDISHRSFCNSLQTMCFQEKMFCKYVNRAALFMLFS